MEKVKRSRWKLLSVETDSVNHGRITRDLTVVNNSGDVADPSFGGAGAHCLGKYVLHSLQPHHTPPTTGWTVEDVLFSSAQAYQSSNSVYSL